MAASLSVCHLHFLLGARSTDLEGTEASGTSADGGAPATGFAMTARLH